MAGNESLPARGEDEIGWEVFASGWALGIWLCNLSRGVASTPARAALTVLCAAVLAFPRSPWVFGALAVAYVVHFFSDAHVTDTIYTWVVVSSSVMILLALLPTLVRDGRPWAVRAM